MLGAELDIWEIQDGEIFRHSRVDRDFFGVLGIIDAIELVKMNDKIIWKVPNWYILKYEEIISQCFVLIDVSEEIDYYQVRCLPHKRTIMSWESVLSYT